MAYEAIGWLGKKVGVSFSEKKGAPTSQPPEGGVRSADGQGGAGGQKNFLGAMNDAVFGTSEELTRDESNPLANIYDGNDGPGTGGGGPPPLPQAPHTAGGGGGPATATSIGGRNVVDSGDPDHAPVDENGLPLTRDWYFYNAEKGHWDVTPSAPEWVKKEHAEKLAAQNAPKEELAPPPPPPPPLAAGSPTQPRTGGQMTPQYAANDFFSAK